MGVRDAQRLGPVKAAIEGRITNLKGAELTGLSLRQFKRLKARVCQQGARGLAPRQPRAALAAAARGGGA